jgi:hypothetical protein
MVHGFDIPRTDTDGFRGAVARSHGVLENLGLELITVETNAWELPGEYAHFVALRLASVLHLVAGRFGTGLIPASASYEALLLPLGSSPVTDRLLGSSNFAVVNDGAGYNRLEKLRLLAGWGEAIESLRFCPVNPRHDRNCGRCTKCILMILTFRVLGIEPRCFDPVPTDELVLRRAGQIQSHPFFVHEARTILDEADARGIDEPWMRALRRRVWLIRSKQSVRELFPVLADRVAAAHRRVHTRRNAFDAWRRPRGSSPRSSS